MAAPFQGTTELAPTEASGKKVANIVLVGIADGGSTLKFLAFAEQAQSPIQLTRRLADFDLSKLVYNPPREE